MINVFIKDEARTNYDYNYLNTFLMLFTLHITVDAFLCKLMSSQLDIWCDNRKLIVIYTSGISHLDTVCVSGQTIQIKHERFYEKIDCRAQISM